MYLAKLELQGFKTFAQKIDLVFPRPKGGRCGTVCVVGPNGSGKSNLSDAVRWALGEQSLRLLRGKQADDVIFSGSASRARAGFAEVTLTFDNSDHAMPVDFAEAAVTRRLYRDGTSEYLLNGASTRLSDIRLLLAHANVGQQSYGVVGQGMVDHVLVASPEERKAFFDDATGVRPLRLKRHEAALKLQHTSEHLAEAERLLQEIEPRLRTLRRQASRLEKRGEIEGELFLLEEKYYGTLWCELQRDLEHVRAAGEAAGRDVHVEMEATEALERKLSAWEQDIRPGETDAALIPLQKAYQEAQRLRSRLRETEFETEREIALAKVRAQSGWAPLPLSKIIEEAEAIAGLQRTIAERLHAVKTWEEAVVCAQEAGILAERSGIFARRLQRPAPEEIKPDPILIQQLETAGQKRQEAEKEVARLEKELEVAAKEERTQRSEASELRRSLLACQHRLHECESRRHATAIELARLEERERYLSKEIEEQMKDRALRAKAWEQSAEPFDAVVLYPDLQRLRSQLELIGGIDPETAKEYEETQIRFSFLGGQIGDLQQALRSTQRMIDELDERIRCQSEEAFRKINKEFQRFFRLLFDGGSCALVPLTRREEEVTSSETEEVGGTRSSGEEGETTSDPIAGVEIEATPPGKRLKSLSLLSGGERALTSIALICAIMATNPAPFVLLDEVDAALDEANTVRFASILGELAKFTQFIVITHNRATMETGDVLYGVTMGDDGVSRVLSVSLEEAAQEGGTARR